MIIDTIETLDIEEFLVTILPDRDIASGIAYRLRDRYGVNTVKDLFIDFDTRNNMLKAVCTPMNYRDIINDELDKYSNC